MSLTSTALLQVIITLDVEDQGNADFWKEFNPEAWATAEAAGMKNITQCAALSAVLLSTACSPRSLSQLRTTIALSIVSAGPEPVLG